MGRKKPAPDWQPRPYYAWDSPEAKAIKVLHQIAGRENAFFAIWRRKEDGSVSFSKEMTDQFKAFANAPDQASWAMLTRQQAAAWEAMLGKAFDHGLLRKHLAEGSRAPWPWPPSIEGKVYPDGPGPTEDDLQALANEGQT